MPRLLDPIKLLREHKRLLKKAEAIKQKALDAIQREYGRGTGVKRRKRRSKRARKTTKAPTTA